MDTVTTTEAVTTPNCPAIFFEVTDAAYLSTLDTLFTWDSTTQKLTTYSTDLSKLNASPPQPSFSLIINAYYDGGVQHTYQKGGELSVTVTLGDPCDTPTSLTDPG